MHILVVDDESEMRDAISEYFGLRGFKITSAANGCEMYKILNDTNVDLVLLDIGLPSENGLSFIPEIRATQPVGIIIVSAYGDSEDRVLGLESGADDYVVKPFIPRELLARVHSVLRRVESSSDDLFENDINKLLQSNENKYDRISHTYHKSDNTSVVLSPGESDLFEFFLDNPDRAISRDVLLDKTVHRAWEPFDRTIDVRVNRLRHKIEEDPSHPKLIRTVRGVGYLYKPAS